MTNEEAKFILNAYRPNGRDAADAMFGPALEQAKQDPALSAWFAREQAHGAAVAAKLGEIAPPAGLREAILAGARASGRPPSRAWWAQPWLAAAAAIVVLLGSVAVWRSVRIGAPVRELAESALDDVVHGKHGGHGAAASGLQRWLGTADVGLAATAMPVNFEELRQTGCRSLTWGGHEVLEVCFARKGAEFHLYIARREDMPNLSGRGSPALVANASGSAAAVWSDARFNFALVSSAGTDALKRLL